MAVPFYIAEGLASSFPGIASKAYWGKKKQKSDPFKQSGIVKQKMRPPTRPKGRPKGRPYVRKGRPEPRYPMKTRRSNKKRKRSYSTSSKYKFKKAKKIRTKPSKFASRTYDDIGSLERDHCAYLGFQHHGSKSRMWDIIGEAITKALLAKIRIYPRAYDEPFTNMTMYDRLGLVFKRVAVPGGTEQEVGYEISFSDATTFEGLADMVTARVSEHAERTNDADALYAYYPIKATFYNSASPDHHRVIVDDLGESIVEIYAKQTITVKNMTQNDDNNNELDVVGTNPIVGKKYIFNNYRPKLIDSIEFNNADLGAFYIVDENTGVNASFSIAGAGNKNHMLAHPPVPRQLFTNCAKSANVYMSPGGMKVEVTQFKMKHKLSTLVERIYYNQYDKGTFGACTFFAFERKARQISGNSRVKLSFDRNLRLSAHCQLKTKKTMMKHYQNTVLGQIQDTPP